MPAAYALGFPRIVFLINLPGTVMLPDPCEIEQRICSLADLQFTVGNIEGHVFEVVVIVAELVRSQAHGIRSLVGFRYVRRSGEDDLILIEQRAFALFCVSFGRLFRTVVEVFLLITRDGNCQGCRSNRQRAFRSRFRIAFFCCFDLIGHRPGILNAGNRVRPVAPGIFSRPDPVLEDRAFFAGRPFAVVHRAVIDSGIGFRGYGHGSRSRRRCIFRRWSRCNNHVGFIDIDGDISGLWCRKSHVRRIPRFVNSLQIGGTLHSIKRIVSIFIVPVRFNGKDVILVRLQLNSGSAQAVLCAEVKSGYPPVPVTAPSFVSLRDITNIDSPMFERGIPVPHNRQHDLPVSRRRLGIGAGAHAYSRGRRRGSSYSRGRRRCSGCYRRRRRSNVPDGLVYPISCQNVVKRNLLNAGGISPVDYIAFIDVINIRTQFLIPGDQVIVAEVLQSVLMAFI